VRLNIMVAIARAATAMERLLALGGEVADGRLLIFQEKMNPF